MPTENTSALNMPSNVTPDLKNKIIALFEYRMFPQLLEKLDLGANHLTSWTDELIGLQAAIYQLDANLEGHWDIRQDLREDDWRMISDQLQYFMSDLERHDSYVKHIRKYEAHELAIRRFLWPTRLDMEYFYFYKSCDVKLLRRLIYEKGKLTGQIGPLSMWRYFDLITEVNDDVSDVGEDMPFFNGNRFLIHILQKGSQDAESVFSSFINHIEKSARKAFENQKSKPFAEIIFSETIHQCEATRIKMIEVLQEYTPMRLHKESVLSVYLSS